MSIPLNNLYHFVEAMCGNLLTLYLFLPHGSKKIDDLQLLKSYTDTEIHLRPRLICHDQEPLFYGYYTDNSLEIQELGKKINNIFEQDVGLAEFLYINNLNLATATIKQGLSIFDQTVLLHSEKNSEELDKYESNGFIGAYYWSHALLARDWYRFAQFDTRLDTRNPRHLFLIYSRGFTGSREYRLKFIEQLVFTGLKKHCQISILKCDQGIDVKTFTARNQNLQVNESSIFDVFDECIHDANASADYDPQDFETTLCSVVLETEFDGKRIHLTEKILLPIACGHPFILAAGPQSLKLLQSYGFKTFSPFIDESYDQEFDTVKRLDKIAVSMQKIASLPLSELRQWVDEVQKIANFNRQYFFSNEFFKTICAELKQNLDVAIEKVYKTKGKKWLQNRSLIRKQNLPGCQAQLKRQNEVIKMQKLRFLRSTRVDQKSLQNNIAV